MSSRIPSIFAALILWLGLTVADIAVVSGILQATNRFDLVTIWHVAMIILGVTIAVALYVGTGGLRASIWFIVLIASGWEDWLYFALQGLAVPAQLPWLPWAPTAWDLYRNMAIGAAVLAFYEWRVSRALP